jgi:hypothetical protein
MMLAVTSEWNDFTVMSILSPLLPFDLHALYRSPLLPDYSLHDICQREWTYNCMGITGDLETACLSWL